MIALANEAGGTARKRAKNEPGRARAGAQVAVEGVDEQLDAVIELSVPRDESISRLSLRAQEQGRTDDTEEVIANRLAIYERETAPILGLYGTGGLVMEVDGVGTLDEITDRIVAALEARGLIRHAAA